MPGRPGVSTVEAERHEIARIPTTIERRLRHVAPRVTRIRTTRAHLEKHHGDLRQHDGFDGRTPAPREARTPRRNAAEPEPERQHDGERVAAVVRRIAPEPPL